MAKPAPAANATTTTFQICSYNPLGETVNSDGCTVLLDMNDGTTFTFQNSALQMESPKQVVDEAENPRADGAFIGSIHYQDRYVQLGFVIKPQAASATVGARTADLLAAVRNFLSATAITPFTIRFAWPGASQYSYLDCKVVTHDIEADPRRILNGRIKGKAIFRCEPGFRGDRLTLQNLAMNPGFENPFGGGIAQTPTVFNDAFTNVNAYATQAGSNPTVAANVMTIPSGARIAFGSPAWGSYDLWRIRFKWVTGLTGDFLLHYTDANNLLDCFVTSGNLTLRHIIAAGSHTLANAAPTLTNGNFYWLTLTQYPPAPGNAPMVEATLNNDSAGAIGSAVTNGHLGPVATFDAVTALVGRPQISTSGAAMDVGGNFSNVHFVQLFGPGGAWANGTFGTGVTSGAWHERQRRGGDEYVPQWTCDELWGGAHRLPAGGHGVIAVDARRQQQRGAGEGDRYPHLRRGQCAGVVLRVQGERWVVRYGLGVGAAQRVRQHGSVPATVQQPGDHHGSGRHRLGGSQRDVHDGGQLRLHHPDPARLRLDGQQRECHRLVR
jgi:hypothetical protein